MERKRARSSSLRAFFTHLVFFTYLLMRTLPASEPCLWVRRKPFTASASFGLFWRNAQAISCGRLATSEFFRAVAKVLGVSARRGDVELPPRQLVEARRGRHPGAGDEDLRDAGGDRLGEVHLLLALGRGRELRG